jgi:hypothetical protein
MNKENIVAMLLEKMNIDTRNAGVQNNISLVDIEQRIIENTEGLKYLLNNLYDFILEKELFKNQ